MPEGTHPYPRWTGALGRAPAFPVIAAQEVRRAVNNQWSRVALTVAFAYVVVYLGSLWAQTNEPRRHTWEQYLYFLDVLRWAALALAATMAGPALLEDQRKGALELYLSRAVTRFDHLAGKVLAVLGLTWVAMVGPALLYFGFSFVLFENHPENWNWAWAGALGYTAIWAIVVAGAGLGLSCVMRSSRAATITLFAGLAALDKLVADLLNAITRSGSVQVISPFSALEQQKTWLFLQDAPYAFPWWWGLITLGVVAGLGWALVLWRHPRVAGVET